MLAYSTAVYVFHSGDVIADGNTISVRRVTRGSSASTSAPCSRPAGRSSMSILATRTRPGSGTGVAKTLFLHSVLCGPKHTAY